MANWVNAIKSTYETNDGDITLKWTDEIGQENEVNILEEMQKLGEEVNVTIKKWKPKRESNLPPMHEYACGCGQKIKHRNEELSIHCNECDEDFERKE